MGNDSKNVQPKEYSTEEQNVQSKEESKVEESKADVKSEGVMTHAEYIAAEVGTDVVIEAYVQATQSWWDNKIVMYLADQDGGYFAYNVTCTEEQSKLITKGTKVKVSGQKANWAGEIELREGATFEIEEGNFIATANDVTSLLGTDELINHQNEFVSFKGLTAAASKDANGNEVAFLYKWNGSGEEGDDLYFNVTLGEKTYTFTVESYLCGKDTDVYKAVKALKVGDKIDLEGFLYWYDGVNPHITSVKVVY